ncbi:hypothetical protein SAMN05421770_10552 [Granulicella rosea]|uniref:Uncharacterized protein n=1 Tax=Granulicella rosea TaxID=474952 RepID=A0A239KN75_9BACT|nr:hypothetical protein SAMN05421770_10552 [Granulicella rosea]
MLPRRPSGLRPCRLRRCPPLLRSCLAHPAAPGTRGPPSPLVAPPCGGTPGLAPPGVCAPPQCAAPVGVGAPRASARCRSPRSRTAPLVAARVGAGVAPGFRSTPSPAPATPKSQQKERCPLFNGHHVDTALILVKPISVRLVEDEDHALDHTEPSLESAIPASSEVSNEVSTMYQKGNTYYADWRDRKGVRKRKAFTDENQAQAYEDHQKGVARPKTRREGLQSPKPSPASRTANARVTPPTSPTCLSGSPANSRQKASGRPKRTSSIAGSTGTPAPSRATTKPLPQRQSSVTSSSRGVPKKS